MRIIITADDFGYCDDTVDATIACFQAGALTSASIIPGMPASERAIDFALRNPRFSFGLHLTLVGDGEEGPVSDPGSIRRLLNRQGRFRRSNYVRLASLLGLAPQMEIRTEIAAQVGWLTACGIVPSHVDSHGHLHKYKPVRHALAAVLAQRPGVRVRNVQNVFLRKPVWNSARCFGAKWERELTAQFQSTRYFYMPTTAGDQVWPIQLLGRVSGPSLEVGVHPGIQTAWRRREAEDVCQFSRIARDAGHQLIGWREL